MPYECTSNSNEVMHAKRGMLNDIIDVQGKVMSIVNEVIAMFLKVMSIVNEVIGMFLKVMSIVNEVKRNVSQGYEYC